MKGKLRDGDFFVGAGHALSDTAVPRGEIVTITDKEDHFMWGIRYKVAGYDFWFEANCFEYVEEGIK